MQSAWCSTSIHLIGEPLFNETADAISTGGFSLSPIILIQKIIEMLTSEIKEVTGYIILFFCLSAVGAIVNLMSDSFRSKAGDVSFFACYTLTAATAVKCFSVCLGYTLNVIGDMTDFITKLSPLLAGLIVTSGAPASAGAFHPVLMTAVYVVSVICRKCIIPLASYSVILSIANNMSNQIQLSNTCRLISSVSKWILALSFTLFTGICGIYGFSAPALDAITAKAVKFTVGSLVPVVGGFLSDTLETVISGGKLMKNSVGTAGIVVLITVCAVPVIKTGVMSLIIRISSALAEPISDIRISRLLNDISNAILILFGMTATVTVLFIICISIILAAT